jgi:hypothetical protein
MTTEIVAEASTLTPEQAELQARARAFVEEVLFPLEVEAERARRLPAERIAAIRHAAIDRRLAGGLHAVERGGRAATHPGGSVIALNGRNAAMAVLADTREPAASRSVS